MKTCEESASITFETQDVAVALAEADVLLQFLDSVVNVEGDDNNVETDLEVVDVMLVKEFLSKLEVCLTSQILERKWVPSTQSYSGDCICPLLERAGLSFDKQVCNRGWPSQEKFFYHQVSQGGGKDYLF